MSVKYLVTAKTGSNHCSSTNIKIKFGGTLGISPDPADGGSLDGYTLNSKYNDFEGGVDTFEMRVPKDIGQVIKIWLTGSSKDYWSVEWVRVWKEGEQEHIHQFNIDHLLKGETIAWLAEGVDPNLKVSIETQNLSVYKETEFKVEQNGTNTDTYSDLEFTNEYTSEVFEHNTSGRSMEHSWFVQAAYTPPDLSGGVSYGAGYAGNVAESIEKATGTTFGHKKTITIKHHIPLEKKKFTSYQVVWHEVVTTGSVTLFDGQMEFRQVRELKSHFDITGTYDTAAEVPHELREGTRIVPNG